MIDTDKTKPEFVDVDRHEFHNFVVWTCHQKVYRSVARMCEPPVELFYDYKWLSERVEAIKADPFLATDAIIARASLVSLWPGIVDLDPRSQDEIDRDKRDWWREGCNIRRDFYDKWMAGTP